MYDIPQPPYVLLGAGLLAGIISCVAFITTLKMLLKEWSKHRSSRTLAQLRGLQIILPFTGISIGILFFLASCLQIFSFSPKISYAFSLVTTALTAGLVWFQFTQILYQLETKGSKGIDLDDLSLGQIIPQSSPRKE